MIVPQWNRAVEADDAQVVEATGRKYYASEGLGPSALVTVYEGAA